MNYEGKSKNLTPECPICQYNRSKDDEDRCYWGVAWKRIVEGERTRHCQYYDKPSPRDKREKELEELRKLQPGRLEEITQEQAPSRGGFDIIGRWERE